METTPTPQAESFRASIGAMLLMRALPLLVSEGHAPKALLDATIADLREQTADNPYLYATDVLDALNDAASNLPWERGGACDIDDLLTVAIFHPELIADVREMYTPRTEDDA